MPETRTDVETVEAAAPVQEEALSDEVLTEESLVEEVSIDGMCGVY